MPEAAPAPPPSASSTGQLACAGTMFFITILTASAYYIFKIQVHPAGQAKPHMHMADCHSAVREDEDAGTHHVVMTVCGDQVVKQALASIKV